MFALHIVTLAGLIKLMVGKVTPEEDAILDRAISETYARARSSRAQTLPAKSRRF